MIRLVFTFLLLMLGFIAFIYYYECTASLVAHGSW